jgi:hypothetical protein
MIVGVDRFWGHEIAALTAARREFAAMIEYWERDAEENGLDQLAEPLLDFLQAADSMSLHCYEAWSSATPFNPHLAISADSMVIERDPLTARWRSELSKQTGWPTAWLDALLRRFDQDIPRMM